MTVLPYYMARRRSLASAGEGEPGGDPHFADTALVVPEVDGAGSGTDANIADVVLVANLPTGE